jgi:hypothetical protein
MMSLVLHFSGVFKRRGVEELSICKGFIHIIWNTERSFPNFLERFAMEASMIDGGQANLFNLRS